MIDGYKYAKSHEWAKVDGDVATVGISDHAQVGLKVLVGASLFLFDAHWHFACSLQSELGDVVYVELPEVGKAVKQGETFGVVESVKVSLSLAKHSRSRSIPSMPNDV